MANYLDHTHEPEVQSWVTSANDPATDFPIQNLPFGMYRVHGSNEEFRPCTAIGTFIVDLLTVRQAGCFEGHAMTAANALEAGTLNAFMSQAAEDRRAFRHALFSALSLLGNKRAEWQTGLVPMREVEMSLPAKIGDYTDFYTSVNHATAVGRLFRPDNPLLPNYKWVPIGYHGRSSSIGVSGKKVRRPVGQIKSPSDDAPRLAPSQRLDYELEVGMFVGSPNELGESITIGDAEKHLFGLVLLNDWSARDFQAWEYQPLGPFLSKNFSSTISPWIVTMEALAPFRAPFYRSANEPQPLPYLDSEENRQRGSLDLKLEVWLQTKQMRANGQSHERLMQSNFKDSYWTMAQLVTHHTVGGCNLQTGDLLGSGTQSGEDAAQGGSLLELSVGGKIPYELPGGETRTFLEDEDSVIFLARAEKAGFRTIGFGSCEGQIVASHQNNQQDPRP
ncbi:MAG: fumarylacetoacetase [Pseudomonadota bacterium]